MEKGKFWAETWRLERWAGADHRTPGGLERQAGDLRTMQGVLGRRMSRPDTDSENIPPGQGRRGASPGLALQDGGQGGIKSESCRVALCTAIPQPQA